MVFNLEWRIRDGFLDRVILVEIKMMVKSDVGIWIMENFVDKKKRVWDGFEVGASLKI